MKITSIEPSSPADGKQPAFAPHAIGVSLLRPSESHSPVAGVAALIGEAVFGHRVDRVATRPGGPELLAFATGQITVADARGVYRLRREEDAAGPRLTIASISGLPANADTIERLSHSLPPSFLSRVFFWQRGRADRLAGLLSDRVAADYRRFGSASGGPTTPDERPTPDQLQRRDALAAEIERQLAERRAESARLDGLISELDTKVAELSGQRTELDRQLQATRTELEEVETRLRYHTIAEDAEREASAPTPSDWGPQLDDIEAEIARWRATLADLEQREAVLRSELTQTHPDDGSPSLTLADQRAAIAVASRLADDLDSEVARLARAAGSQACVGADAHPRLNPLVETLCRQLRILTDLADQQERAIRVQELQAEADHVARSQQDLRQQLDHLLARRQDLWRSGRPKRDTATADGRDNLLGEADAAALADRRARLMHEASELAAGLEAADAKLDELRAERDRLAHERSGLLTDSRLVALQREFESLQRASAVASRASARDVSAPGSDGSIDDVGRWRASDLFAQLTDGRFRSLRLVNGGRDVAALDAYGYERAGQSLGDQDRDLAAVSLMIAMAERISHAGVELPLVFDEPFAL
ncbi:MAG: hypothetical protein AAGG46_06810, partial [Planctomycetota bacterium]